MITQIFFPLIGGFINRVRGGFLPTGHTQVARLIYSVVLSLLVFFVTTSLIFSLLCIPLFFLGSLAPNGDWMNMRNLEDFKNGSISGIINVLWVFLAAFFFFGSTPFSLYIAGCGKGIAYTIAKFIPSNIKQFSRGPELGELIFGIMLGLGIAFW